MFICQNQGIAMNRVLLAIMCFFIINCPIFSKQIIEPHSLNNNHFGTFLGITTNTFNRNSDFTIGLDYEYILPALEHTIGFGLITEYVYAEHSEYVFAVPIFFHVDHNLRLLFCSGYFDYK